MDFNEFRSAFAVALSTSCFFLIGCLSSPSPLQLPFMPLPDFFASGDAQSRGYDIELQSAQASFVVINMSSHLHAHFTHPIEH